VQAGDSIPTPPPICGIGRGLNDDPGSCPSDTHPDVHWPRNCPEERDLSVSPEGGDPDAKVYCRPNGAAPLTAIHCVAQDGPSYTCEAEPIALDGTMSYQWSSDSGLLIHHAGNPHGPVVQVDCLAAGNGDHRRITLSVRSEDGGSATVTGQLWCQIRAP
jgi:hypothetical protein